MLPLDATPVSGPQGQRVKRTGRAGFGAGARYAQAVADTLRIPGIQRAPLVGFSFAGQAVRAPLGENLAAALMAGGIRHLGEGPGGARAAVCLAGACQQCLVRIEGRIVQAGRERVRDGLAVAPA